MSTCRSSIRWRLSTGARAELLSGWCVNKCEITGTISEQNVIRYKPFWKHCSVMWQNITVSYATRLFVQQLSRDNNEDNIKALHDWPFTRVIERCLVETHSKEPVIRTAFPWHEVIMLNSGFIFMLKNSVMCVALDSGNFNMQIPMKA